MKLKLVLISLWFLQFGCSHRTPQVNENVPAENRESSPPAGVQNNPGAPEPVRPPL